MFIGLKISGKLEEAIKQREASGFTKTQICKEALWQLLKLDGKVEA